MPATLEKPKAKRRIAIADDIPSNRKDKSRIVGLAGFEPIPLLGKYRAVDEMLVEMKKLNADGLVCDHRLNEGNFAKFEGGEAVAALYGGKLPALLVTDYGERELLSIRKYRRRVPVLIRGGKLDPDAVAGGIEAWEQEVINANLPLGRRPRSTIVIIDEVDDGPRGKVLTVFVPRWNQHESVCLSEEMFPDDIRLELKKGRMLTATVNTDADNIEDLYFEDFKLTPDEDLKHEKT